MLSSPAAMESPLTTVARPGAVKASRRVAETRLTTRAFDRFLEAEFDKILL